MYKLNVVVWVITGIPESLIDVGYNSCFPERPVELNAGAVRSALTAHERRVDQSPTVMELGQRRSHAWPC